MAFDVGGFAVFVGECGFAVETEGVALGCCCGEEGPGEGEFAFFLGFDGLCGPQSIGTLISTGREAYTYEKSLDIWQYGDGKCFELFESGTKSRLTKVNYCLCVVFTECRVLLGPIVSDDEVKKAVEEGH